MFWNTNATKTNEQFCFAKHRPSQPLLSCCCRHQRFQSLRLTPVRRKLNFNQLSILTSAGARLQGQTPNWKLLKLASLNKNKTSALLLGTESPPSPCFFCLAWQKGRTAWASQPTSAEATGRTAKVSASTSIHRVWAGTPRTATATNPNPPAKKNAEVRCNPRKAQSSGFPKREAHKQKSSYCEVNNTHFAPVGVGQSVLDFL